MTSFLQKVNELADAEWKRLPPDVKAQLLNSLSGLSTPAKRGPKPGSTRRGPIDLDAVVKEITSVVAENPNGVNSEFLQQMLDKPKDVVVPAIRQMLEAGTLRKTGEKRGTKYFPARAAEPPAQVEMPIAAPPKGSVPGKAGVVRRKKQK